MKVVGNPPGCTYSNDLESGTVEMICQCTVSLYRNELLSGGADGKCLCPAGQYLLRGSGCSLCESGKFTDTANANKTCTQCDSGCTPDTGSSSASDCTDNPAVEAQRQHPKDQREIITIYASVLVLLPTAGVAGACLLLQQKRKVVQQNLQMTEELNACRAPRRSTFYLNRSH